MRAFEGLDTIPGSKKKRRELSPKEQRRRNGETNGWDASPIKKTVRGQEMELFTISALAAALEKAIVSIRLWEDKGYIPPAPYRFRSKSLNGKKTGGNRAYTRALIESCVEEFDRRGLIGTSRIEWNRHQDLTAALTRRWKEIMTPESPTAS